MTERLGFADYGIFDPSDLFAAINHKLEVNQEYLVDF